MKRNKNGIAMKLSKVKFLDASNVQELSKEEQKLIWGGYAGSSCCFYVNNGVYECTTNPDTAYEKAGRTGTWACNTTEAKATCASRISSCRTS